jgi:hypothetical protein
MRWQKAADARAHPLSIDGFESMEGILPMC